MRVASDGTEISYRVEGKGEPVTLVHGVGANLGSWDEVTGRLAPRFKVIRLDLRGHGKSDRITGSCSLNDFVADVLAVLDDAGVARTNLFGFSLGGMIAQSLAMSNPHRVNRLALISAVAGRTAAERRNVLDRAEKVRNEGIASVIGAAVERWFTAEFCKAQPEKITRRLNELLDNDPVSYAKAYQTFAESDLGERLHQIGHRTLVVTGENDVGSNPRMAHFMHEQIRNSELIILPKLRHSVLVEASDSIADLLLNFLHN